MVESPQELRRFRVSDRLSGTLRTVFEGKLDRRFFPYFDYLLGSEHSPEEHAHFNAIYVRNYDLEERLRKRLTSPSSQITAITGARGIGKSTSIRYYFGVSTQPKLLPLEQIFAGEANENGDLYLVIPFFLDTHNISTENVQRVLTSQIQSAAELAAQSKDLQFSDTKIFDFVHTHKSQLVTHTNLPLDASTEDRMEAFRATNPYGYATELLKYVLHKGGIGHVVLIVDDIESCAYAVQKELVKGVLKLRDCLKNVGSLKRNYVSDYIFTCRPATFKLLHADPEIDGFSVGHPIEIARPASLYDIVRKRFDYAVQMIGEGRTGSFSKLADVKNLDSWRSAYSAFEVVISRIASIHEEMIIDLCNHDVRRALIELQETLRNSRWYENTTHQAGAFVIADSDYSFSSAGLIRALVLRDHEFFSDELDSAVPNLFVNRESPEFDLMLIHIIKMFFERTRSQRVVAINKSDIKQALRICYPKEVLDDFFEDIMSYGVSKEIFRAERVPNAFGRATTFIVPLNKGFCLWKMCKEGSVFLEFFRDNTFLKHRNVVNFPSARTVGTSRLPEVQKFILCADFVNEIAESELSIQRFVQGQRQEDKYRKVFGKRSVSRHIYWGLRSSARRVYPKKDKVATIPIELEKAISIAGRSVSKITLADM